jgi:hypothetical protein
MTRFPSLLQTKAEDILAKSGWKGDEKTLRAFVAEHGLGQTVDNE